jgi:ribonuclease P protein component
VVPGASGSARGRRLLRLRPTDRLRKRFEFGRVRDEGRRVHTRSFVVVLRRSEGAGQRLGLTVSQKVGCAVRRNRVKRLVREVFRLHRELFPGSADIVVIAKTGCPAASFHDVHKELGQAAPAMRAALQGQRRKEQPARTSGPRRERPR